MKPDGGDNWLLGVVRRISRESQSLGAVGIETVGRSPAAVNLDISGLRSDRVLPESGIVSGDATLLFVSLEVLQDFRSVNVIHQGTGYRLRPLVEVGRGEDYVIGRYWVDTLPV